MGQENEDIFSPGRVIIPQKQQPEMYLLNQQLTSGLAQGQAPVFGYNQQPTNEFLVRQNTIRNNPKTVNGDPAGNQVSEFEPYAMLKANLDSERTDVVAQRVNTRPTDFKPQGVIFSNGYMVARSLPSQESAGMIFPNGNMVGRSLPNQESAGTLSSLNLPFGSSDQVNSQQPAVQSPYQRFSIKAESQTKQTDDPVFDKEQTTTSLLQANVYKHINTSIGKKSVLNITDIGKWIPGTRFRQTCSLDMFQETYGCCGEDVRKMQFKFNSNVKNGKQALDHFASKMKGETIILFGDSIMKNFYFGLVEVLKLGKLSNQVSFVPPPGKQKCSVAQS